MGEAAAWPLTDVQAAYWLARGDPDCPGIPGTNLFAEYDLPGAWLPFLQHAVRRLIDRHDALRVVVTGGLQRVLEEVPRYRLEMVDLRGVPSGEAEARLEATWARLRHDAAPVDRWPLFQFVAHALDDGRVRLLVRIDKFLADGESRLLLERDLFAMLAEPAARLPAPDVSYAGCLDAARRAERSAAGSRAYWRGRARGLPPLLLPPAGAAPARGAGRTAFRAHPLLPADRWRRVRARAGAQRLTPSMVAIAALADAAAEISGRTCFTLPLLGMQRPPDLPAAQKVIGNFTTLHLLEVTGAGATFADRAAGLRRRVLTDMEHQGHSGYRLLRDLHRTRGGWPVVPPLTVATTLEYRQRTARDGEPAGPHRVLKASAHIRGELSVLTVSEGPDGSLRLRCQVVDEAPP
ncbi:MAG: hypothetical protein E6J41_29510, partial [Chloroflexi bacterium]